MTSQICVDAFETHMLRVITNITVLRNEFSKQSVQRINNK